MKGRMFLERKADVKTIEAWAVLLILCVLDVGNSFGTDILRIGGNSADAPVFWKSWTDLKEGQVGGITLIGDARSRLFGTLEDDSAIQPVRPDGR